MSTDVLLALCFGVGVTMVLQRQNMMVAVALLCVVALAYIITQTKAIQTQPGNMEYTTYINTPFEMDVVEQDGGEKKEDQWQEWNEKYTDNSHIHTWLRMFGTQNDFDGFHLV
jgi:hypothetical protein